MLEALLLFVFYLPGLLFTATSDEPFIESLSKNYTNHLLFNVNLNNCTIDLLRRLNGLQGELDIDFWDEPRTRKATFHFRVSPTARIDVENFLSNASLPYEILTENIQLWIDEERDFTLTEAEDILPRYGQHSDATHFDVERYHPLDEIETYLKKISLSHPNTTELASIGKTAEGRDIWLLKLVRGGDERQSRPIIWLDAGIHAREWIAPATALYVLHRLVTNAEDDVQARFLLDSFDWYIVPMLNPDGYVHSWTLDRFWRKNRSTPRSLPIRMPWTLLTDCVGVDLNRNFDISFGGSGTSGNPCSYSFRGDEPFSERETLAVRNTLLENRENLKAYVTLHAYSQMWMMPYAYTMQRTPDYPVLIELLREVTEAVKSKHGETYSYGPMSSLLYSAAGSSPDWVYKHVGVKHSFLVELRDRGRRGFVLPAMLILPTGQEFFEGLFVLATNVHQKRDT